jgi:perosamine synthetase
MPNKRIPWWETQIGQTEYPLVKKVLASNFINEGELTAKFEKELARLLGCRHAITATSGTMAIFLALKGVGVRPGDEVIVPDMTFIATANAVKLCGAKPVLVDVNESDLNISIPALKKAITPKTRAIVPVHVTGRAADMGAILKIARQYKLAVVEDAAEALMSKYRGKYLGTFGDAGCFSFSPNKTVTTGQGGLIVTNSDKLAAKLHALKDQGRPVRGTGGDDKHDTVGYNLKFSNILAAVGLGQLGYLRKRTARMRRHYQLYAANLKNIKGLELFSCDLAGGAVPQWTDIKTPKRNELAKHLRQKNMDTRNYWFPLHTQKPYRLPDTKFPHSTKVSPLSLWLPSAFTLTDRDILTVCREIKNFFKK